MRVGVMLWRIGDLLDLREQVAWVREHGFAAVAFWTCAGQAGEWQGFDAEAADEGEVAQLKRDLEGLASIDLHAAVPLPTDPAELGCESGPVRQLLRTVGFGGEIGAGTVTMHVEGPLPETDAGRQALLGALGALDEAARAGGLRIGLELTGGYDLAMCEETPSIGLTLDVGHVSMDDGAGYREFGSLPGLIGHVGARLFHVHAHDYNGNLDHLPIGAGDLDWPAIAHALRGIGYEGVLCLELNPNRASPEDILRSRERLEALVAE